MKPWLDKTFEFQPQGSCFLQTYDKVDGSHGHSHRHATDCFYGLAVGLPIYYPGDFVFQGDIQLETTFANTRHRSFGLDNVKLTARYLFMDDISEDPVSVMFGVTGIQALRQALNDLGSFHHGLIEGEVHVSIGKECSDMEFWASRWWTVLAIGQADVGSPWLRVNAVWEKNLCNQHHFKLFMNTLWGLGNRSLHLNRHFHGYGSIRHQSVDIGFHYGYWFEYGVELSVEYTRRVYAKNFPENVNIFQVAFSYPFGL